MHLDIDAGLGNTLLGDAAFSKGFAPCGSLRRTLAHQLERAFGDTNQAHAVMDASRSKTALGDLETAALAE